jgi:hypothetical protein
MNDKISELINQAGFTPHELHTDPLVVSFSGSIDTLQKFAMLIIAECAKRNKHLSYELMGVITDMEENDGFDQICLDTLIRVQEALANKDLTKQGL